MTKPLRITTDGHDLDCLVDNLAHPDAPTWRFGILPPFTKFRERSVLLRRYGLWVHEVEASQDALAALQAALAADLDANALELTAGEFLGCRSTRGGTATRPAISDSSLCRSRT